MIYIYPKQWVLLFSLLLFISLPDHTLSQECYYLYPYNLHITEGGKSKSPLVVKDHEGNILSGNLQFVNYDQSLISIDNEGYVTGLRTETDNDIGTWVGCMFNGIPTCNTSIVRVLSEDYDIQYNEIIRENTVLYYPASIPGVNIQTSVEQYQIGYINELAFEFQQQIMNVYPFNGCRQIIEIDFGESDGSTVCGISGNPFRLGWNINGNEWSNCFLVPFFPPRSPQWFVFYHELGHNMTWPSSMFAQGLGIMEYSEGIASVLSILTMEHVVHNAVELNIRGTTCYSLETMLNNLKNQFLDALNRWKREGADFSKLNPDIVDGIYLYHRARAGESFDRRFFFPIRKYSTAGAEYPLVSVLGELNKLGSSGVHTFFAALISYASESDLSSEFTNNYNYPIHQSLFDEIYDILDNMSIMVSSTNEKLSIINKDISIELNASHVDGDQLKFIDLGTSPTLKLSDDGKLSGNIESIGLYNYDFQIQNLITNKTHDFSIPIMVHLDSCSNYPQLYDSYIKPVEVNKHFASRMRCYSYNNSRMSYSILEGPEWISIDSRGYISGTPDEVGEYPFQIKIENKEGFSVVKDLNLEVVEFNKINLSVWKDETQTFGNQLVINGYVNSPDGIEHGMLFDWGDGNISFGWFAQTHVYKEPGHYRVVVSVADGADNYKENTTPHTVVGYFNKPPFPVVEFPDQEVILSDTTILLEFDMENSFHDPDGDSLSFSVFSEHDSIANVCLDENGLLINPRSPGITKIFIEINDNNCGEELVSFNLEIISTSFRDDNINLSEFGLNVFPNPFDQEINISFNLARKQQLSITIFDFNGNKVQALANNQYFNPGANIVKWNGNNSNNVRCSPGSYLVLLQGELFYESTKCLLLSN